ncbi:MAG: RNA 2',3'-cyclic phosphodiesterase [Gemmatimonadetes bacterium]|nr:RNA 2',3'-cyclic phosphodiesterase [Gemmatimonadota bacterium]
MRLFLAVTLPEELQDAIERATAPARAAAPRVRWVRAAQLHLTMKFIGERPASDVGPIAEVVREVVAGLPALRVTLRGAGAFPNFRRPRVVWLGMHPPAPLATLARHLDDALTPLGVDAESRPFRAHVTLGRVGEALAVDTAHTLERALHDVTASWSLAVRGVALVQSTLGPGGPSYRELDTFPLGAR